MLKGQAYFIRLKPLGGVYHSAPNMSLAYNSSYITATGSALLDLKKIKKKRHPHNRPWRPIGL
jgi:hypothetical protein